MNIRQSARLLPLALLAASVARAGDESSIRLHDAPQLVTVRASCSGCHSLDYLEMNAPFLKRAGWEAEVRKMIKVFAAPIREEDVAPIVEYLTAYYGSE